MHKKAYAAAAIFLTLQAASAQQLHVYTKPSEPNKINYLDVTTTAPEGFLSAEVKYWILEGPAHLIKEGEKYLYTAGPGTTSRVLFVVAFLNKETSEVQTQAGEYLLTFSGPKPPDDDKPAPTPSTLAKVTIVYEKGETTVARPIRAALKGLNARNVLATMIDKDAWAGNEEVPLQYVVALEAASEAGYPCLVAEYGDVVRVIKNPTVKDIEKL